MKDNSDMGVRKGVWKRRIVQLVPIQLGRVYLALDDAGDVWEVMLLQGRMATVKQVSLWKSLPDGTQQSVPQESVPWP